MLLVATHTLTTVFGMFAIVAAILWSMIAYISIKAPTPPIADVEVERHYAKLR